jgi:hypothetical protein
MDKYTLLKKVLLYWSEFGDNPHQLFEDVQVKKDLDNYMIQNFIKDINNPIDYQGKLYRFIKINHPSIDQSIEFKNPTSWTTNQNVVDNMAIGVKNPFFLILDDPKIHGIFNEFNQYQEEEFILIPMTVKIIKIQDSYITVSNILNK